MKNELRLKAEEVVKSKRGNPSNTLSIEEMQQDLYELQVHQVELQMQNEELSNAYVKLDAMRARYFDLFELAPVGYVAISEKGIILEANLTATGLLGVHRSNLINKFFSHPINAMWVIAIYHRCRR